jgi:Putative transposase
VPCRPGFFLPLRGLSRRLRRWSLARLEQLYSQGPRTCAGCGRQLAEPSPWRRFLATLWDQEGGYAKAPQQEAQPVLKSLARYTHRGALSHRRLVALENGQVTFRSKDYQHGHRLRPLTLAAVAFLRRLRLPVPPHGFHRMRPFGFLAHRVRQGTRAQCRPRLRHGPQPCTQAGAVALQPPAVAAVGPGAVCPVCQSGHMPLGQTWYRQPAGDRAVPGPGLATSSRRQSQPQRGSRIAGLCRLERRGVSTIVARRLDRGAGATPEAVA